jgi:hypothetical protein
MRTVDVLAALELTTADLFDNPNGVDYRYDNGRVSAPHPGQEVLSMWHEQAPRAVPALEGEGRRRRRQDGGS